ncbi:unnamed protein product, partial [Pylaiella littoralis]
GSRSSSSSSRLLVICVCVGSCVRVSCWVALHVVRRRAQQPQQQCHIYVCRFVRTHHSNNSSQPTAVSCRTPGRRAVSHVCGFVRTTATAANSCRIGARSRRGEGGVAISRGKHNKQQTTTRCSPSFISKKPSPRNKASYTTPQQQKKTRDWS